MAKEYGKMQKAKGKRGIKSFYLVLIAFLCGYLSAEWLDVNPLMQRFNQWFHQPTSNLQAAKNKPIQTAHIPKPKFEFYTLLTNGEASSNTQQSSTQHVTKAIVPSTKSTPTQPVHTAEVVSAKPAIILPAKETYLVQVGAFKAKQDAERMKASLTLKGFSVTIATVTQNQANWYRVLLGPYPSRIQAEKAQIEVAKSEHIRGMIRKMDA